MRVPLFRGYSWSAHKPSVELNAVVAGARARSAGLEPATFWFVDIVFERQGPTLRVREGQNSPFIGDLRSRTNKEGRGGTPGCGQMAVKTGVGRHAPGRRNGQEAPRGCGSVVVRVRGPY
jgi:hypothetical protein